MIIAHRSERFSPPPENPGKSLILYSSKGIGRTLLCFHPDTVSAEDLFSALGPYFHITTLPWILQRQVPALFAEKGYFPDLTVFKRSRDQESSLDPYIMERGIQVMRPYLE